MKRGKKKLFLVVLISIIILLVEINFISSATPVYSYIIAPNKGNLNANQEYYFVTNYIYNKGAGAKDLRYAMLIFNQKITSNPLFNPDFNAVFYTAGYNFKITEGNNAYECIAGENKIIETSCIKFNCKNSKLIGSIISGGPLNVKWAITFKDTCVRKNLYAYMFAVNTKGQAISTKFEQKGSYSVVASPCADMNCLHGCDAITGKCRGMITYYSFEGNTEDSSGNMNNGINHGAKLTSGKVGQAYSFNGANNYIDIVDSNSLKLTSEFTISAWIYRSSDSNDFERIISKSDLNDYDYWLQIFNNDKLDVGIKKFDGSAVYFTGPTIPLNQWVYVTVVKDSTKFYIYINGNLISSGITSGTMGDARTSSKPLNIGRLGSVGNWNYKFNGIIDEIRIINYALTDSQILNDYNSYPKPPLINIGLQGNYGFLTFFTCGYRDEEINSLINPMIDGYGIKEFQFQTWFKSYSEPTNIYHDSWLEAYSHRDLICEDSIKRLIQQIHKRGGRAWAYVQAMGSEYNNLPYTKILDNNGNQYMHGGRFYVYALNSAWADYQVNIWANEIKNLGFDGIHWDTLGPLNGQRASDVYAFFIRAHDLLEQKGLAQTFNFVDMSWWDRDKIKSYLEFPYAEVWTTPTAYNYYSEMDNNMGGKWGVFAMYPGVEMPSGWTESQTMLARWKEAPKHHLVYLVVGNGNVRMKGRGLDWSWYGVVPITPEETADMQQNSPWITGLSSIKNNSFILFVLLILIILLIIYLIYLKYKPKHKIIKRKFRRRK